ncbi:MAG: hypothetical protein GEU71_10295 [Actinobacteria bacterium]|nr:hypothetical protein [Actinomycetota bacterium]
MLPSRQQPEPPEFLVDRSLGRHHLPNALRDLGFVVHTLADVYGERRAQEIADREWIERAGQETWVVLTKDDRIRYRRVERDAFVAANLRVFCLTTAKLRGEDQTARFVNNINRILQRSRKSGPYIYGVYEKRLGRIWP